MKIEIEIPDFVPPERMIFIMAGIEKIGYIMPHTREVFVKVSRCSRCGRCCQKLDCPDLVNELGTDGLLKCDKADMRPFLCCVSEPKSIPECTSCYEVV